MKEKQLVGEKAAEFVQEGMIVGLGTGSTVYYTLKRLGERVREGMKIQGIPTSIQTEKLAKEFGIPLTNFSEVEQIDVAIDGADEVDCHGNLTKGGGGALLREKIIAKAAKTFIVVADSSKLVDELGTFLLPVEVIPFGFSMTERHIRALGCSPEMRLKDGKPFVTDNGNYILDCNFPRIEQPETLEHQLNMIPGVVENGLFVGMADILISVNEQKGVLVQEM